MAFRLGVLLALHLGGRGYRRLDDEGAGDSDYARAHFGAIDEDFFLGGLVVGYGLECDVGHDAPHLFALVVLLAFIDKAPDGTSLLFLKVVPGKGGGEDALAREGQGHPACVYRDPAPPPLLGNIGGCARAAGGVQDEVAGIGGHENTARNAGCRSLNDIYLWV